MILLSAHDLSRQFDADPIFRGVTFDVRRGEKIAIVGPNGCGKTTLLNILAGVDDPDVGTVDRQPAATFGAMQQYTDFSAGSSLRQHVQSGLEHLYDLQSQVHTLAAQLASAAGAELRRLQDRYDHVHAELERLDAFHIEHRVDEVLHGLGFTPDQYERPLATFSGGQQNRALLGRLLLAAPDLLILDEPTNHLDIAATEWLEGFLIQSQQAVVVVSHDRMFLDRVTSRTFELWQGGITDYPGNFSFYWTQRDERLKVLRRTYEKQQEFIEKTKDFIARNKSGQKSAQAKDREKKLERVERVEIPPEFPDIPMGFPDPSRTGDWVIRTEHAAKGFGPVALFTGLTLQIDRGDRLGIVGPNGSGKTTLLRMLIGELAPDSGHVRFGTGVELGYFDQQLTSVNPAVNAIEAVREPQSRSTGSAPFAKGRGTDLSPAEARGLLARFGIRGELSLQQVSQMSGGERTKVALARVHALRPNVMFLDEPTNHLDFWACAALERSLSAWCGTLLFVSHDRYFIDRVATKVLVFEADRWRVHEGNYSDYQHFLHAVGRGRPDRNTDDVRSIAAEQGASTHAGPTSSNDEKARRKRTFPYRKVEDIETDIARVEVDLARLSAALSDPQTHRDGARIKQVQSDYASAQLEIARLLEHWEEAAELN